MGRHLPEDLIPGILLCLPVKSLTRFRAVCKSWNDIIRNPYFTQQFPIENRKLLPWLLVIRSDNNIFSLDINTSLIHKVREKAGHVKGKFIPFSHPDLKVVGKTKRDYLLPLGSCHGIICIRVAGVNQIYLWNPHTNQCRCVGHPRVEGADFGVIHKSGFGFVPSINDYKIVLVVGRGQIFVYSLRANSWRELHFGDMGVPVHQLRMGPRSYRGYAQLIESVQIKDGLYWISRDDHVSYLILKFDLVNDVFEKETNILDRTGIYSPVSIGIVGDDKLCICLFTEDINDLKPNVETSVMEKDGNNQAKWKSLVKVKGEWGYLENDHKVLGVAGNGKVLIMEKRRMNMESMLIVDGRQQPPFTSYFQLSNEYDPPNQTGIGIKYAMSYFPSLVSPFSL